MMVDSTRIVALGALLCAVQTVEARDNVVRVVHEPRRTMTLTTKTEKAWTNCNRCNGRVSYERTFHRDQYSYDIKWVEDTRNVPQYCRSCQVKVDEIQKLEQKERELDRRIYEKELRQRIKDKRNSSR